MSFKEAGGMTEDADAKSVNLAASLSDEEVIYVANKMKMFLSLIKQDYWSGL